MMPLSRQEEFFVPEFCEEQVSVATTEVSNHPDQSAIDDLQRTSSRNSSSHRQSPEDPAGGQLRRSTSSKPPSTSNDSEDEAAAVSPSGPGGDEVKFVKPTKPAPKRKVLNVKNSNIAEEKMEDLSLENEEDSLSSSFEDLKGEEILEEDEARD